MSAERDNANRDHDVVDLKRNSQHRPMPQPISPSKAPRGGEGERGVRRLELGLTACLVVLKLRVLQHAWGKVRGFDAYPWLETFRATHWFRPLPAANEKFSSYHPPLSFLLCRAIYAVYPHAVPASQILSTLSILGAVFALRGALRAIGVLWTLPGLAMLYVTASIPLVIWLSVETTYDALLFMWFTVVLLLSVRLFWQPMPSAWWKRPRYAAGVAALAAALAAGLLTKFNAVLALGLPWIIVTCRRGPKSLLREWSAPLAAIAAGVLLVAPLYYTRYYRPLGQVFPQPMEWLRTDDLKAARALRDADPVGFVRHMLRIPAESVYDSSEPVRNSFIHSIWLQTWKRDGGLLGEPQGHLSSVVSNVYVRGFAPLLLASTALLLLGRRRLPVPWGDVGCAFLTIAVVFSLALLAFAWKYPLWDWEVFKAKYVTPIVLEIAYAGALPLVVVSASPRWAAWRRIGGPAIALVIVLFMFINHILPVY